MSKTDPKNIIIPKELLPKDGRFGSGPSKIRPEQLNYLNKNTNLLGTSHRQAPIKNLVASIQEKFTQLFELPDDYEVILTNGGASLMWDAATFSIIEEKSAHATYGEFSSRFAKISENAPHLKEPTIINAEPGGAGYLNASDEIDTYALTHNETSTGVMIEPYRVGNENSVVMIDATSGAGSKRVDANLYDMYYFSLQKSFGSEGGLVFALCSPKMIERISRIDRYAPAILDLKTTIDNSRLHQTLNTPSLSTLFLADSQLNWMLENGGMSFCEERTKESSSQLYDWAIANDLTSPFVNDEALRSVVSVTIDLDSSIDFEDVVSALRANGIVDCDPYRKLGKNQIRIATFPGIDPSDIGQLIKCLDFVFSEIS
ncbi:MAG: phosphoserine transaminase [Acidimicrobiia bacterium]|nr:phosphoserine transaminase [Acidimicrobiia bacterium]